MTPIVYLRPGHQGGEAGSEAIYGLLPWPEQHYRAFFTALMGLGDATSATTLLLGSLFNRV